MVLFKTLEYGLWFKAKDGSMWIKIKLQYPIIMSVTIGFNEETDGDYRMERDWPQNAVSLKTGEKGLFKEEYPVEKIDTVL